MYLDIDQLTIKIELKAKLGDLRKEFDQFRLTVSLECYRLWKQLEVKILRRFQIRFVKFVILAN